MKRIILLILLVVACLGLFTYLKGNFRFFPSGSNSDTFGEFGGPEDTAPTPEEPKYTSNIDLNYIRDMNIDAEAPVIEEELVAGSNYKRYIASYTSEGNKIYGLLTVPNSEVPEGGFPAIVFNHGYIPPTQYVTTEKYIAYVDTLARNGFVVFKIDMRGHGDSEGEPSGSYFSPGYTIDALHALKSLQKLEYVDPERIGMWGHSMAGNLVLRAMLVSNEIKAGVIWAGAVYSYEDYAKYRLNDGSYVRRPDTNPSPASSNRHPEIQKLRESPEEVDFSDAFWSAAALTQNLEYLYSPVQVHHSVNDPVVNVGYSRDLKTVMEAEGKNFELFEYTGGGHNIESPYFETAIQRTVEFFKENL